MTTENDFTAWWMKDNWSYPVDDDRTLVFQAMRGDEIAYDVGPYAIEFATPEKKQIFCENDQAMTDLVKVLEARKPGIAFYPIVLAEDDETKGEKL